MSLKIAIVDDHQMFRSGIQFILSEKDDWEVVFEAENGEEFLKHAKNIMPDLVLMDISMPVLNGYDTTKRAVQQYPDLKIIILSMHSDQEYYYKLIEAGAKGFILKNAGVDELFFAINEVAEGKNYFGQDLLKNVIRSINNSTKINLNDREKKILKLICEGHTNKKIADQLFLSIKTIEKYRHELLQKTDTKNTAHLVMYSIKNKIIQF